MSNSKTLKPFQAGHDPRRNTKGRPRGSTDINEVVRLELEKEVLFRGTQMPAAQAIVLRFIEDACKGKSSAFNALMNRMYGKPGKAHCPGCNCASSDEADDTSKKLARQKYVQGEVCRIQQEWGVYDKSKKTEGPDSRTL